MGQGGWEISGQSREIDLDFVASAPGNLRSQAATATLVCRALSLSHSFSLSTSTYHMCLLPANDQCLHALAKNLPETNAPSCSLSFHSRCRAGTPVHAAIEDLPRCCQAYSRELDDGSGKLALLAMRHHLPILRKSDIAVGKSKSTAAASCPH
jgi:hypothetical protein